MYAISAKAEPALGFLVKELQVLEAAGDAEAIDVIVRIGQMGADAAPAAPLLERIERTSTVREDRQVAGGPSSARAAAIQALRKIRGG
jgi:aspartate aminotransferase-like enzyme